MVDTRNKILDISVNLARISDWILSENTHKQARVDQFLQETKQFLSQINNVSDSFKPTLKRFKKEFNQLLKDRTSPNRYDWAEKALTWANILSHRAKLA